MFENMELEPYICLKLQFERNTLFTLNYLYVLPLIFPCCVESELSKTCYRVLLNPTFLLNIQQSCYCFPENSQIYKSIYICWQPFSPFMPSNNWLWQLCKCLPFKNKPNSVYPMEIIIKNPDTQWKCNVGRNISTK